MRGFGAKAATSDDVPVAKGFHEHRERGRDNSVCNSGPDSTRPLGPATGLRGATGLRRLRTVRRPGSGTKASRHNKVVIYEDWCYRRIPWTTY